MIYLIVSIFCAKKEVIIMKHNETHLELFSQLETLVIFRDLLQDPVIGKLKTVLNDENIYLLSKAQAKQVPKTLEKSLLCELKILEEISQISPADISIYTKYNGYLPAWDTEKIDFVEKYQKRIELVPIEGYGIYSRYNMFIY